VNHLKKQREVVVVDIQYHDPATWFIGGKPVTESGETAFFLKIELTEETNTRDEKKKFIRMVFDGMSAILPNVSPVSYIICDDVPGTAWGYGGETQEFRYITGSLYPEVIT
jgi:4-oxalocrotonate tautomerase